MAKGDRGFSGVAQVEPFAEVVSNVIAHLAYVRGRASVVAHVEPSETIRGNLPKDTRETLEITSVRVAQLAHRNNAGGHLPKSVGC